MKKRKNVEISKNRKVLMFIDETGTPGDEGFSMGFIVCYSRIAAKLDASITKSLPDNINEIKSTAWSAGSMLGIIEKINNFSKRSEITIGNKLFRKFPEISRAGIYGHCLVETVNYALGRHKSLFSKELINNVEVIVDRVEYFSSNDFKNIIAEAQGSKAGHFRAVEHICAVDSGAVRLLQVADVMAAVRRLDVSNDILDKNYNVVLL